jgi:hypothetical protein
MRGYDVTRGLIALLVLVGLVLGAVELHYARKQRADEGADLAPAANAWFRFERCMIGKPLRVGEDFVEREKLARAVEDQSYPARCAEHLERVGRELESAKLQRPELFDQALSDLAKGKTLQLGSVVSSLSWRFEPARRQEVPDVHAPAIQPLLDPLELATLPVEYYRGDRPHGRSLRLAPNVGAGHACVFDDLTRGRCGYAPDDAAAKLEYPELLAGDERTLPAFATQTGIIDVFSGRTLLDGPTRYGYVSIDGRVTALIDDKTLVRSSSEGRPERATLPPKASAPMLLSASWLLASIPGPRDKPGLLLVFPLAREALALGEPITFRDVPASLANLQSRFSCAIGDAHYVWFRETGQMLVGVRDSWKLVDGALRSENGALSCDAKAAYVLALEGNELRQARCTQAGCSERKATLPKQPAADGSVAAQLGDRVVLIRWRHGLAFLRSGSIAELDRARPQLLFALRLIHDIDLFPRDRSAIGILQAMDLRRLVFGIDREGIVRTVPLRTTP